MRADTRAPASPGDALGSVVAYLLPAEVAALLKVSRKSIYRWVQEDPTMPALKIGRVVRFPRERFLDWLASREQGLRPMRKLLRGSTQSGTSAAQDGRALPDALSGRGIA
jgi:excisionase family DNA binding protein